LRLLKSWFIIRLGLLICLIALIAPVPGTIIRVRAANEVAPVYQEGYPVSTNPPPPPPSGGLDDAYPAVTIAPPTPQPTATHTQPAEDQQPTPATPTETPEPSATSDRSPSPDAFQTENAEMGGALVTPPTPEPTASATVTPPASTEMPPAEDQQPTPAAAVSDGARFQMDWGMFWVGFAIPFLAACGLVLYLLDRKPDFFRLHRR